MSGGCRECTYPEALAPDLALAILNLLHEREPVPAPPKVLDKIRSDEVAVTFKECEDDCEPSAEQIEAMEHERGPVQRRSAPADYGNRRGVAESPVLNGVVPRRRSMG
jgi:hypothetical protein